MRHEVLGLLDRFEVGFDHPEKVWVVLKRHNALGVCTTHDRFGFVCESIGIRCFARHKSSPMAKSESPHRQTLMLISRIHPPKKIREVRGNIRRRYGSRPGGGRESDGTLHA